MTLLLIFLHSFAWSTPPNLSQLIDQLENLPIDPTCQEMTTKDLATYCAEELCGKYKDDVAVINSRNFRKRLSPEELKKVEELREEIKNYFLTLQNDLKSVEKRIEDIKNQRAPKELLESIHSQELVSFYNKTSMERGLKRKMDQIDDITASCQAAMVVDIINRKGVSEELYLDTLQKIDQAYLSKLSLDSAKKLRGVLKENVQFHYETITRDPFHVSPHQVDKPLKGNSPEEMLQFVYKFDNHLNSYSCNSSLERAPKAILTDSVLPQGKNFTLNMSPYTCTHGVSSAHIVAHEIGHMINFAMTKHRPSSESKKKHLAQRECIKTQGDNRSAPFRSRFFLRDKFTTEEDHADAITFSLNNHQSNFCALLASDGKDFYGLKLTDEKDSHSPSILRVMRDYLSKGMKLPDSCRELAKRTYPKEAFNQCPL